MSIRRALATGETRRTVPILWSGHDFESSCEDDVIDLGFLCPVCNTEVYWSICEEPGATGRAYCSMSGHGTRHLSDPILCDWTGLVVRLADGGVALVAQSLLGEKKKRRVPRGAMLLVVNPWKRNRRQPGKSRP